MPAYFLPPIGYEAGIQFRPGKFLATLDFFLPPAEFAVGCTQEKKRFSPFFGELAPQSSG